MKIEVKLDDPRFCNGCKLIVLEHNQEEGEWHCIMGFWSDRDGDQIKEIYINHKTGKTTGLDELGHPEGIFDHFDDWCLKDIRPPSCIDVHGE